LGCASGGRSRSLTGGEMFFKWIGFLHAIPFVDMAALAGRDRRCTLLQFLWRQLGAVTVKVIRVCRAWGKVLYGLIAEFIPFLCPHFSDIF
jgi:hypothetical protein